MKRFDEEPLGHNDERQADILRRSTLESDRKFWSGERPISLLQGIGLAVMFLSVIGAVVLGPILLGNWPKGDAPLWAKIVNAYGVFIAVFVCFSLCLVLGNRRFRRGGHSPGKD
jgi:uncharacterized BrkB/YihY/UPF0761 family membrane protein